MARISVPRMSQSAVPVARGRFRPGCWCGRTGRLPEARTSGVETTVFNVLDFVLGCGKQDVPVPFDGRMNLDMLFEAVTGFRLGVEYDGAYWHQGREERDAWKRERLIDSTLVCEVLRIRERPLRLLGPLDISVPRAASGQEIATNVLAHLGHTVAHDFGDVVEERIHFNLYRPGREIDPRRIRCRRCRQVLN